MKERIQSFSSEIMPLAKSYRFLLEEFTADVGEKSENTAF